MVGKTGLPSEAAPSICSVTPVMKAAPGLSKNTMAALISASVARRRSMGSTGASTETGPIKIYSGARAGSTPALNALATVMLVITLLAIGLAGLVLRRMRLHGGDSDASLAGLTA